MTVKELGLRKGARVSSIPRSGRIFLTPSLKWNCDMWHDCHFWDSSLIMMLRWCYIWDIKMETVYAWPCKVNNMSCDPHVIPMWFPRSRSTRHVCYCLFTLNVDNWINFNSKLNFPWCFELNLKSLIPIWSRCAFFSIWSNTKFTTLPTLCIAQHTPWRCVFNIVLTQKTCSSVGATEWIFAILCRSVIPTENKTSS